MKRPKQRVDSCRDNRDVGPEQSKPSPPEALAYYRLGYTPWLIYRELGRFGGAWFDDQPDIDELRFACAAVEECLIALGEQPPQVRLCNDLLREIPEVAPAIHSALEPGISIDKQINSRISADAASEVAFYLLWSGECPTERETDSPVTRIKSETRPILLRIVEADIEVPDEQPSDVGRLLEAFAYRSIYCSERARSRQAAASMDDRVNRLSGRLAEIVGKNRLPSDRRVALFELGNMLGRVGWRAWLPDELLDPASKIEEPELRELLNFAGLATIESRPVTLSALVEDGALAGYEAWARSRIESTNTDIENALRLSESTVTPEKAAGQSKPLLEYDFLTKSASFCGEPVDNPKVTGANYAILYLLWERRGAWVLPAVLAAHPWGGHGKQLSHLRRLKTELRSMVVKTTSDRSANEFVERFFEGDKTRVRLGVPTEQIKFTGRPPNWERPANEP